MMMHTKHDIYFDNSATTQVCEEAASAALSAMREEYGNPSAVHHRGAVAFQALNNARRQLAERLSVPAEELFFTSCGTESNNTVIFGAARAAQRGGRILYSAVEHASVANPARELQSRGFDVQAVPVDGEGRVDLSALAELLTADTALVSIMQVNNETGAVQPLTEVGRLIREKAPKAVFHVDGVQAFGRIPVELARWGADAYTASGHKIHAPKGVGLLWAKNSLHLPAYLHGGGQERGFRSGTENVPGILAFAAAAEVACSNMAENEAHLRRIKAALLAGLQPLANWQINGPAPDSDAAAPHVLNISFLGCRSEVLLHCLEEKGIYVSAGSACNSRSSKGSTVLGAMGISPERVDSALRFSFGRFNTEAEAEAACKIVVETVEELRFFTGRSSKKKR